METAVQLIPTVLTLLLLGTGAVILVLIPWFLVKAMSLGRYVPKKGVHWKNVLSDAEGWLEISSAIVSACAMIAGVMVVLQAAQLLGFLLISLGAATFIIMTLRIRARLRGWKPDF